MSRPTAHSSHSANATQPFRLEYIFHPTDFSDTSEQAFIHALKLAYSALATLHVFHVTRIRSQVEWGSYPRVRPTLERWGILPPGSSQTDVAELGLRVKKVVSKGPNPVIEILEHLDRSPTDLMVIATHARRGVDRMLYRAVAGPVARGAGGMILFFPPGVKGFVDPQTGDYTLQRVLIPIDHSPPPQLALHTLARLLVLLGNPRIVCTLIHVGSPETAPAISMPNADWTQVRLYRQGDPVEEILQAAEENQSELIVMATAGRQNLRDTLHGSTAEQVVRDAPCPVLTVSIT